MALMGTGAGFDTVSQMLASTVVYGSNTITHNDLEVTLTVAAGDIWAAGGFRYQVAAAGVTDYHLATAGGVLLYVIPNAGAIEPEQYGAVGDGVTDDTEILRKMLRHTWRTFRPKIQTTYAITGQLDFGRYSRWETNLLLNLSGNRTAAGANLGVQTGGGSQHLTALFVEGDHQFRKIKVSLTPDATNPWLAIVGNDFYLRTDGSRPAYDTSFECDVLDIRASSYVTGYSGDGNGAVRFAAMDSVRIGRVRLQNFRVGGKILDVNSVIWGSQTSEIYVAWQGVQFTRCGFVSCGDMYFKGYLSSLSSVAQTDRDAEYTPGGNALLVRGVQAFSAKNLYIYDTGEHGIRHVSYFADATTGKTGLMAATIKTNAMYGHVSIYRPGGSGFKAASGDSETDGQAPIRSIAIASLYVEDAGAQDYSSTGTYIGNNHFGLNLQSVQRFSCGSFVTRLNSNTYNGKYFALLRNIAYFDLATIAASDCYGTGLFWNIGSDSNSYHIRIGGGHLAGFGAGGTGYGMAFYSSSAAGRVDINCNISNGPSLIYFDSDGTTTPADMWTIKVRYFNVTTVTIPNINGSRRYFDIGNATRANALATVEYCVGQQVTGDIVSGETVNRNAVGYVFTKTTSQGFIVSSSSTVPTDGSTILPGRWVSRGTTAAGQITMERIY